MIAGNLGVGVGIDALWRLNAVASIDYAVTWPFADTGLTGTPWADVTRTGLGTTVDEDGNVVYGPHNLLLRSQDFSNAAWVSYLGGSKTAGTITLGTGALARCEQDVALATANMVFTFSMRVSVASGTAKFRLKSTHGSVADKYSDDLTATTTPQTFSFTVTNSSAAGSGNQIVGLVNASDASSNGVTFIVEWAQINLGSITDYVPTTTTARYLPRITHDPSTLARLGLLVEGQRTQLLGQVDNLAGSDWTGTNASVAAGAQHMGRDTWVLTNVAGGPADRYQDLGNVSASTYVCRVRLWAGTSSAVQIALYGASSAFGSLTASVVSGPGSVSGGSGSRLDVSGLSSSVATVVDIAKIVSASEFLYLYLYPATISGAAGGTNRIQIDNVEAGSNATSYIPNSGTGTAVRVADSAGPGLALTSTALSAAFPGGVTAAFTGVIKYRKAYSVSSNETVFALSAGSSAGTTNLFALRTNGTQAQLVTSAGPGTLSGTLVHDGSTVNKIAYSCDPTYAGSELVTNGNFSTTPGGYTAIMTTSLVSGGIGRITSTDTGAYRGARLTKSGVTIGKTYRAVAKMRVAVGSSTVTMGFIGGTRSSAVSSASFVETTVYFVANDTTIYLDFTFNTGGTPSAVGDAFELDDISIKEVGAMSISVNGATAVETTGIAYTGSGVAALIAGSQTYAGSEAMGEMIISEWDNSRTSYITGSSLAALSA